MSEREKQTRLFRIDKRLEQAGWQIVNNKDVINPSALVNHAVREYPTESGPADYVLFVEGNLVGAIEAKKLGTGPENVMDQAKRYSLDVKNGSGNWDGYKIPFLYSSNGELIYFLDKRNPLNNRHPISDFHRPEALKDYFARKKTFPSEWLAKHNSNEYALWPFQWDAVTTIENRLVEGSRRMMINMATGTGKTRTSIASVYRLLEAGAVQRVLFLVDRRALAAQAIQAFSAFNTPNSSRFDKDYEVYSQRIRKDDLEDDVKFNAREMPDNYLTNPVEGKTFVYISTIQRMSKYLFGNDAEFEYETGEADEETDAGKLEIPIHAFDLVVADECHRGYTSKEQSLWRRTLEYFDAVTIGLTATPASHTTAYFGHPVFRYTYDEAVTDGFLVPPKEKFIRSKVKMEGAFLKPGETIGIIDTETGQEELDMLEDERSFNAAEIEKKITAPDTNKKIIREIAKYAMQHEKELGRFPKTLIFACNDLPHRSHADQVARICREVFGRGDDFVQKITGSPTVDKPLKKIKEFRNRPNPGIVVSVDMLSTGVDIPRLEFIVFLRPVKSRILWEQMLGRGTRKCDDINKEYFTIFDCFEGTLVKYFRNADNFKLDTLRQDSADYPHIINKIWTNEDRDEYVKRLIRRLRRIERTIGGEAIDQFSKFIPDGDVKSFADSLQDRIKNDFINTMKLLRNEKFQELLVNYKRPKKVFYIGHDVVDEVSSWEDIDAGGQMIKPQDYLTQFTQFIQGKEKELEALRILLERPQNWNSNVLHELREYLNKNNFGEEKLQRAHRIVSHKNMADIISIVRHAIREEEALLEATERVERAIQKVFGKKQLTPEQQKWVDYLSQHLVQSLALDESDFEEFLVFTNHGGKKQFKKIFAESADDLIREINAAIAA